MTNIMTDDQFLNYCTLHSRTPRALFHRDHVLRLLKLAGEEHAMPVMGSNSFAAMHDDVVDKLVDKARARMEAT